MVNDIGGTSPAGDQPAKPLSPAARRALDEAEERRGNREKSSKPMAKELNGRKGPDPARYGDWESKGIVSDF